MGRPGRRNSPVAALHWAATAGRNVIRYTSGSVGAATPPVLAASNGINGRRGPWGGTPMAEVIKEAAPQSGLSRVEALSGF